MDLNKSHTPDEQKDLAQTPPEFFNAFQNYMGEKFTLDAAALSMTAKVENHYSLIERNQDGLALPWGSWTWCNPPYSDITPWISKAIYEAALGNKSCLLVPNKPEVGYIRLAKKYADTFFELPYRLNFLRPDGSRFRDSEGRLTSPKFPVTVILFTRWGLSCETRHVELDLRPY